MIGSTTLHASASDAQGQAEFVDNRPRQDLRNLPRVRRENAINAGESKQCPNHPTLYCDHHMHNRGQRRSVERHV